MGEYWLPESKILPENGASSLTRVTNNDWKIEN
jgi:hypothetical protein